MGIQQSPQFPSQRTGHGLAQDLEELQRVLAWHGMLLEVTPQDSDQVPLLLEELCWRLGSRDARVEFQEQLLFDSAKDLVHVAPRFRPIGVWVAPDTLVYS